MRLLIVLLVLIFAVLGAVFGALNSERVVYDFYFITATVPKGAALIAFALAGWLLGGIVVYFGLVLRLRRRVRTLARELRVAEKSQRETVVAPLVVETVDKAP
jgi:putative membrane protein